MKYLVTILALVPSIAHAYFNNTLDEQTIYQNKVITNNYPKYASISLITNENSGLKSKKQKSCTQDERLYNGQCVSTECEDKYPFTTKPDTNKGAIKSYTCFGKYRYAYFSCNTEKGWVEEKNKKYDTIADCIEAPGKEGYPLTEKQAENVDDFANTSCKYFGGVNRCRINSCDNGWDPERNGAGQIINCTPHDCTSSGKYYTTTKPDPSVGKLLPPCKSGGASYYGYESCNQGYSGPSKGQCNPIICAQGYVYTATPITGCQTTETCNSAKSTYYKCSKAKQGYYIDTDWFVKPNQCDADYIYESTPIKGCRVASEVCYSGDKTLYKCLKADDGYTIDDDGKVNPNSCEGYDYATPDIPDCLEVSEACLSGDKNLYKCLKQKTCDGYPFEDKSTMTCFGTIEECTVGGKTYYKCTPTTPTIEYPCKNLKNEHHYLLPKGCYHPLFDPETWEPLNECIFFAKAGCPAVVNNYIIGTIVEVDPKDKNGDELYRGILVAGLDTINYEGEKTTEPTTWGSYINKPLSNPYMSALTNNGADNTGWLQSLYKNNSVIWNVSNYLPAGFEDWGGDYSKHAWFLPSKYELQLAQTVTLLTRAKKIDSTQPDDSYPQLDDSHPLLYITSTIEGVDTHGNPYISVVYGYEEDSESTITKIATYERQSCSSVDCVRKAYARPFTILEPNAMLYHGDYDSPKVPSDDGNTTPSGGGGGSGRGNEVVVDGPNTDVDTNQKYDGTVEGPEYFHSVQ